MTERMLASTWAFKPAADDAQPLSIAAAAALDASASRTPATARNELCCIVNDVFPSGLLSHVKT
jgi:hypothetical protein